MVGVVVVVVVIAQSRKIKVEKTIGPRWRRRFAQRRRRFGNAIAERQRIFTRVIGYSVSIYISISIGIPDPAAIIALLVIIVITLIAIIIAVAVAVAAVLVLVIRGHGSTIFVRRPHSFANSKRLIEYGEAPRSKAERETHTRTYSHTQISHTRTLWHMHWP